MVNFIESLTDEQIAEFIATCLPKKTRSTFERIDDYISIHVSSDYIRYTSYEYFLKLSQFEVCGNISKGVWIKFLYNIFGEEYKVAYLEYCAKIFN